MEVFKIAKCPTTELSHTNRAILNPSAAFAQFEHIAVRCPKGKDAYVFSVIASALVGKGEIAFNTPARQWAKLMVGQEIEAAPYQFEPQSQCLSTIVFSVNFLALRNAPVNQEFNTDEMSTQFSQTYHNQAYTVGQSLVFPFTRTIFALTVKEMVAVNINNASDIGTNSVEIGLLTPNTIITFEREANSEVKLVGKKTSHSKAPTIIAQDWDFSTMGIGGLTDQFNRIFSRAFATRLLPPHVAEAAGINHVRGILLYGPPGTGKTLIARQIAKMLLAREPKIVNGPEVLNKFVGESEANIRRLFQEAEEEQAKSGINSGLHVIIFDEFDAICKQRGNSASTSGVGDNVVNQLLSKIDGVNSLHNVLLIGMTNRKDLIDEALLRPGRLEVQIEIGLPTKEGRLEIFKIHTSKIKESNMLDPQVDLDELAEVTRNYTGAEIAGLVGAASSRAVNRVLKPKQVSQITSTDNIMVTREDFQFAMDYEIKPALGASEDRLKILAGNIIQWDPVIEDIRNKLRSIIDNVSNSKMNRQQPQYVLLIGDTGSGLTTIAANAAAETQYPFIKIFEDEATAGESESFKVAQMKKLFTDASRSELSCLVVDGLEGILDYSHIGPRFSNMLKAVFKAKRNLKLEKNRRMLVICTCNSQEFLEDLRLTKVFNHVIRVPSLSKPDQVRKVLDSVCKAGHIPQNRIEPISQVFSSRRFKAGIREVLDLVDWAAGLEPSILSEELSQEMTNLGLFIQF